MRAEKDWMMKPECVHLWQCCHEKVKMCVKRSIDRWNHLWPISSQICYQSFWKFYRSKSTYMSLIYPNFKVSGSIATKVWARKDWIGKQFYSFMVECHRKVKCLTKDKMAGQIIYERCLHKILSINHWKFPSSKRTYLCVKCNFTSLTYTEINMRLKGRTLTQPSKGRTLVFVWVHIYNCMSKLWEIRQTCLCVSVCVFGG